MNKLIEKKKQRQSTLAQRATFSRVHENLPRQGKNPFLCAGHQSGNSQEVAATGSPGMEMTATLETPLRSQLSTHNFTVSSVYLCWPYACC